MKLSSTADLWKFLVKDLASFEAGLLFRDQKKIEIFLSCCFVTFETKSAKIHVRICNFFILDIKVNETIITHTETSFIYNIADFQLILHELVSVFYFLNFYDIIYYNYLQEYFFL